MDEKEYIQKVGLRIIYFRSKRNMKQMELAELLEIEDSALRRIEKGRTNPTLKTLLKISAALKISLLELLDVENKNS